MLTFNIVLGYLAYYSETSCDFFFKFLFFFQSDRPTQYQETHSTVNEEKKGDGLTIKNNRTKFTYVCVTWILQPSLASGKREIKLKKANRSINTRKVSLVLKLCFCPKNYITK